MKNRLLFLVVLGLASGNASFAVEEAAPKSHMREVLRARADEEAKKKTVAPSRPVTTTVAPTATKSPSSSAPGATPVAAATATVPNAAPEVKPSVEPLPKGKGDPATVLPKVEVRKSRITETDRQVQLQEQQIAREKKNAKSTETDRALNDPKVSSVLSIFGGESSKHRESIAQERVSLMESERDIIEAMGHARTKEEKQELQKQLDEIKAMRRELEKLRR